MPVFLCLRESPQVEYITHVITARRLVAQPYRRTYRAIGKIHATGGHVTNLNTLALTNEHDIVITHDVTTTYGLEAYGLAITCARVAIALVHRHLFEITIQRASDGLTHHQGGAGRRINLVAVMRLDDFHI